MDQKCTNDTRFYYNKDLDENLKAALLPPTHTVRKGSNYVNVMFSFSKTKSKLVMT